MSRKSLLSYTIGMGGSALLTLVSFPILSWLFEPEIIGALSLFQVYVTLLVLIFSLGLDQYYVRQYNEICNKERLRFAVFLPGLVLILITALLVVAVSLLFNYSGISEVYLLFIGVSMLFTERFLSVFIRMEEKAILFALSKLMLRITFLLSLGLFWLTELDDSAFNLISAQVLSWSVTIAIMLLVFCRCFDIRSDRKEFRRLVYDGLAFGLPLALNSMVFWLLTSLDRIMLERLSSLTALGVYSVAMGIAGFSLLFQQVFTVVWHPTVYRWHSEGIDIKKLELILRVTQFCCLTLITLIGMFSWIVPAFFPEDYEIIGSLLLPCMLPPLYLLLGEITGIGISLTKRTKVMPLISLASLLLNAALNYLLLPLYGAIGAAVSSVVSFFIFFVFKSLASRKLWLPLPILRVNTVMAIITILVITNAFLYSQNVAFFTVLWASVFIIVLTLYRREFFLIVNQLKARLS
mgnify:CR=1 FL=1|tara:strand:+ start:3723 stop:5117 length:1395 start_codon:yes stop_codon:yes gene_type:complete